MMRSYEFRIFQANGTPPIISMEVHLTDNAAMRSATKVAMGRSFEVWRGSVMVSGRLKSLVTSESP